MEIPNHKRHLFVDDSIQRIWQEGLEYFQEEGKSGGEEDYDDCGIVEMHEMFSSYHNSIVGHLGLEHTSKAMSLGSYAWAAQ